MSLAGGALLALWNDVARAREAEYDQWHTLEHVPERVAVPGFRGARRYVNRARAIHRYFTLYEIDSLAALDSPEYQDLLRNPTPWSAAMRPDFANFIRAPFRVERSSGTGIGAAIAVLAYDRATASSPDAAVSAVLAQEGVVAAHAGAGTPANATADWRTQVDAMPRSFDAILLVEALDRAAAARALVHVQSALALPGRPADFGCDVYDLTFVFPGHAADARTRYRRAAWKASKRAE